MDERKQEGELHLLGGSTVYKQDYAPEVLEAFTNKHQGNDYWVMGVSMGGATVMMSSNLGLPDSVYGIIDDCGFTTAKEMIRENCKAHLPKFIPSSIFEFFLEAGTRIWGDFDLEQADACKALSQTDIPVLIIHGNEDTKAPLSMAYKLYDSCRSEKEIYIVNGADHAENYQADPEKYGDIIIRFIKKHMSYSQKED